MQLIIQYPSILLSVSIPALCVYLYIYIYIHILKYIIHLIAYIDSMFKSRRNKLSSHFPISLGALFKPQATKALDRVEEERDEAFAAIAQWEAVKNGCATLVIEDIYDKWVIEGSLEAKLPTIWTDGKAEVGRVKEEKKRSEKIRQEKEWEARRCRCAKR